MLTNEQIDTIHRLHFVEKWTIRKIAKHLHIGRRSVAKYLSKPVQNPLHRTRTSKLDSFKPAIEEWLEQDPSVTAAVIFQGLRDRGFTGGYTIVKDHLQAVRAETKTRRAFVRMEPATRESCTPSASSSATAGRCISSSRTARRLRLWCAATSMPSKPCPAWRASSGSTTWPLSCPSTMETSCGFILASWPLLATMVSFHVHVM